MLAKRDVLDATVLGFVDGVLLLDDGAAIPVDVLVLVREKDACRDPLDRSFKESPLWELGIWGIEKTEPSPGEGLLLVDPFPPLKDWLAEAEGVESVPMAEPRPKLWLPI